MTFSRRQKICFGLLGAGLLAFVADRSFGGPGDAIALAMDTPAATVRAGVTAATAATPPLQAMTLSARLRALSADDATADAFTAPTVRATTATVLASDETAAAFKSAHVLKAVLGGGRGGRVLLDDRLVAVGESVGGMELVDVREQQAVFAGPAGRIVLEMPRPAIGR